MIIPTISDMRDQILSDIQSGLSLSTPLLPRSAWGIFATSIAGAVVLLYRFAAWVEAQIFTSTADIDSLILRANEYGLARVPAQAWRGSGTITGTAGTIVPAGTLWQLSGSAYQNTAQAILTAGSATAVFEALEAGAEGDLGVGDVIEIVAPQTGVNRAVTITAVTQAGEDAESVENFRARILLRQQNPPQGGAIPDWILWALEVPGIAECKVDRPAAGSVALYPLTDDPDPANRIPGAPKLAEVLVYVSDPARAPISAAFIAVNAASELNFDVDIADISPNNATTKAAIESAITSHLYSRRPKQYTDEVDPRDVVSAARLTSIAIAAGADVATVTLKNAGGTPITDYTLEIFELAKLRTLAWI